MNKVLCVSVFIISGIFLIWFILPIINYKVLNPGNVLGIVLCVYLMFWSGFHQKYIEIKQSLCAFQAVKILWKVFNVCAGVFVAYALIISALMVFTAYFTPPTAVHNDAPAIVLGAQVKPWGASAILQQRIDAAVDYMKENPDAKAVVTGGQGSDEPMSEAQCMYENMVKKGINGSRIYREDKATNTKENIKFSYKIIKENNLISIKKNNRNNVAIVTDSFHQLRARIIASKLKSEYSINGGIGSVNSKNGKIGIILYPTYFVREWIAIPFEIIKK